MISYIFYIHLAGVAPHPEQECK